MNLWLRLIRVVIAGLLGNGLRLPQECSRVTFRVWLHDLDPFGHMNNGRYLTIMDLGRSDLAVRSGLLRAARRHKWTPIASAVMIRFRREMRLFQKFRLETRILWWDDTRSVIEQVFIHEGGVHDGQVAAHALFLGGFYDRAIRKFVPIARLMEEVGSSGESPPMTPQVAAYLATDDAMRAAIRRAGEGTPSKTSTAS
ncbi:MAG TPA: thioesterase family protein [Hyphomicrobium sp.]|nr:thioesterase family protein [Hyphomicrobium sp.]